MALVWKSLIAAGRLVNPRILVVLALPVALGALGVYFVGEGAREVLSMLAVFAALFWAMAVLAGSMVTRADLHSDLRYLDFLRALPLTGRQIVLGEAAGSFVPLVAVQWLLLGFTVGFVGKPFVHWFSLRERCALGHKWRFGGTPMRHSRQVRDELTTNSGFPGATLCSLTRRTWRRSPLTTRTSPAVLGAGDPLIWRLVMFDALAFKFRELKVRKDEKCAAPLLRQWVHPSGSWVLGGSGRTE